MAFCSTSSSRPTWCKAKRPRVETARLIDRPPADPALRKSGRRSYISMVRPRRARVSARSEPTGPAPMMLTSAMQLPKERAEPLHVLEGVVERRGREAHDVGRPQIANRAARPQCLDQFRRIVQADGEHRTALRRREHFDADAFQEPLQISAERLALAAQSGHGRLIEQLHRGPQRGHRQDRWIRKLPALGATDGWEARIHLEAARFVVAPPALEARQIGVGVALVDEDPAEPAGPRIEILVIAPGGEIGAG